MSNADFVVVVLLVEDGEFFFDGVQLKFHIKNGHRQSEHERARILDFLLFDWLKRQIIKFDSSYNEKTSTSQSDYIIHKFDVFLFFDWPKILIVKSDRSEFQKNVFGQSKSRFILFSESESSKNRFFKIDF